MPAFWYVDEGLDTLIAEWKRKNPGATVYTIADDEHSTDPEKSQHARDKGTSGKAGDDKGEVDAADFMPGKGVTDAELDELAEGLRRGRDKRLLYVIRRDRIFSSYPVGGQPAWEWRAYSGKYHGHTHVSVNDVFDSNKSDWEWEPVAVKPIEYITVPNAKLPKELVFLQEDQAQDGWNPIMRVQALANLLDRTTPDLDCDGQYGAKSAQKFAKIFGGNGRKLTLAQIKQLHGIS